MTLGLFTMTKELKISESWKGSEELFLESVFARLSLPTRKDGEITVSFTLARA